MKVLDKLKQGFARVDRVQKIGFVAAILIFTGAAIWICAEELAMVRVTRVDVEIPNVQWHALYEDTRGICDYNAMKNGDCPANPANPTLWTSNFTRADKEHYARTNSRVNAEYWIGATITPEQLARAKELEANQLMLGMFRGNHRVWINGEYVIGGERSNVETTIIPVSLVKLENGEPLKVAIQIYNYYYSLVLPDQMSNVFGNGFTTKRKVNLIHRNEMFQNTTRPLLLCLASLILGVLVFWRWRSFSKRDDLFFLACFAFGQTLYHFRNIEAVFKNLDANWNASLGLIFAFYMGMFALFAGLAFGRVRRAHYRWPLLACFAIPVALAVFMTMGPDKVRLWIRLQSNGAAAFAVAGMLVCLVQAFRDSSRRNANVIFGLHLGVMGLLSWLAQTQDFYVMDSDIVLPRIVQLFVFSSMAWYAFLDANQESRTSLAVPASRYHQRGAHPDVIEGVVLTMKLEGPRHDVFPCFWSCIISHGGVVASEQGNVLTVFIAAAEIADPIKAALALAEEFPRILGILEERFGAGFSVTAAITVGGVRPIWERTGERVSPSWTDAEPAQPLRSGQQLLDFGWLFTRSARKSVVVIGEELAKHLSQQTFLTRDLLAAGSDGEIRRIAAYTLDPITAVFEEKQSA